ncbi:uncharacterized protein [Equus caballus]|uniref:uncharacterized protein n=1 Tax=Equus caballus TaxID=9796 RepID=UPI0038B27952
MEKQVTVGTDRQGGESPQDRECCVKAHHSGDVQGRPKGWPECWRAKASHPFHLPPPPQHPPPGLNAAGLNSTDKEGLSETRRKQEEQDPEPRVRLNQGEVSRYLSEFWTHLHFWSSFWTRIRESSLDAPALQQVCPHRGLPLTNNPLLHFPGAGSQRPKRLRPAPEEDAGRPPRKGQEEGTGCGVPHPREPGLVLDLLLPSRRLQPAATRPHARLRLLASATVLPSQRPTEGRNQSREAIQPITGQNVSQSRGPCQPVTWPYVNLSRGLHQSRGCLASVWLLTDEWSTPPLGTEPRPLRGVL